VSNNKLRDFAVRQMFTPDIRGILLNPMYILRRSLYEAIKKFAPRVTGRTLDFGCGTKPYLDIFAHTSEYIGLEYEGALSPKNKPFVDVFYDGKIFPFDAGSFDSVVAFEVLEHIFEPEATLSEIHRVLKPGGMFLMSAPFAWDEHSAPYDYARYTSFALHYLLPKMGFEVVEHRKTTNYVEALGQLWIAYLWQVIFVKLGPLRWVAQILIIVPTTILTKILAAVLPKSDLLYCNNVVLARKKA
jgi:SAM-dependent methyltransferase